MFKILSFVRSLRPMSVAGFLLIGITARVSGQNLSIGHQPITNYYRTTYKAGTQNWSIDQTDGGTVVIGNNKGILTYDGYDWNNLQLPNHTVGRSVKMDSNGRIYIGGQNEIGYIEPKTSTVDFEYVSLTNRVPADRRNFEDIWKIFSVDAGVYYCSEKEIIHFEDSACTLIQPPGERFENYFELNASLYFQDKEKGLFRLNGSGLEAISSLHEFGNDRLAAILPYSADSILLVTALKGLYFLTGAGIRAWENDALNTLKTEQPYCAIPLKDGSYAIGTSLNGLVILSKNGRITQRITTSEGLQNNTVLAIYEDKLSNLWLALDNGVSYFEYSSAFRSIGAEAGIEGTGYTSRAFGDKLYFGTNQGLFELEWSPRSLEVGQTAFKMVKHTRGQVWGLDIIDNRLIINQHSGSRTLFGTDTKPISNIAGAWKIMELKQHPGYALQGTYSGLYLYQIDDDGALKLIDRLNGFDESARIFEEDHQGKIWVSHAYRGLFKLSIDVAEGEIKAVEQYGIKDGLPTDLFIGVAKINDELVFSSPKGIYGYNPAEERFLPHKELTELLGAGKNIKALTEDEIGNIWFSIDDKFGMVEIDRAGLYNDLKVRYFSPLQDLLLEGFENIHYYDPSNIFIATEGGFIRFDATKEKDADFPFGFGITEVTLTGAGSATQRLKLDSDDARQKFEHDHKEISFRFSSPNFQKLNRMEYRFLLDGFDSEWSEWHLANEQAYTSLSPGKYTFRVQARNARGKLSQIEEYRFTVNHPWYASLPARVLYAFVIMGSLVMLTRYVQRREKRKAEISKLRAARKYEEKEAWLKKSVEKSENEVVALRNERLRSEIAHKNSKLASATMHLVQKGEILTKIKSDLGELAKNAPEKIRQKAKKIERTIEADGRLDRSWEQFETYFDQVHENFFSRLRANHPELTPKDQKLCAYLRMNLSTKEIAPLLNISVRGVEISRYRLRKKLDLDSDQNLVSFVLEI